MKIMCPECKNPARFVAGSKNIELWWCDHCQHYLEVTRYKVKKGNGKTDNPADDLRRLRRKRQRKIPRNGKKK